MGRRIPLSALSFLVSMTGGFARIINPKWLILAGQILAIIACVVLSFGDGPDKYWQFILPGFLLGSAGNQLVYTHTKYVNAIYFLILALTAIHCSIAIFKATPPAMAGTIGALFNGALQLGSAIGLAAVSSIETSVESTHGGFAQYYGRSAVFYFFVGLFSVQALGVVILFRDQPNEPCGVQVTVGSTENAQVVHEKCSNV